MSSLGVWADAEAGVGGCAGMKKDGTHAIVACNMLVLPNE